MQINGYSEMNLFSFFGRPDGLGNRLEEIILLESVCSRSNAKCEYIWRNRYSTHSYEICFKADHVKIVAEEEPRYPVKSLSDFDLSFTQKEILESAKKIIPNFNPSFQGNICPVGVHIRGTDRIGSDHPHFMKNESELQMYLSETIDVLNRTKPRFVYVCSESEQCKRVFLRHLDPDISVVDPTLDKLSSPEYADLFSLSICKEIWMVSRFSSFSIIAALIGNVELVTFVNDPEVRHRYQSRFRYQRLTGSNWLKDSVRDQKTRVARFYDWLVLRIEWLVLRITKRWTRSRG